VTTRTPEALARITAMTRWFEGVTSTTTRPWEHGTVPLNEGFPQRWDSNFLRVERPVGAVTADELADEADQLLAGCAHREVVIEDATDARRLAPGFGARGYEIDPLISMVLRREPDRAPAVVAREVPSAVARSIAVATGLESHAGMALDVAERLADFDAVAEERAGTRFFLADIDGNAASTCQLYLHEGATEVENVATLTRFRDRGGARAVVTAAIGAAREAGADLIWLFADANDWSRALYAKLGFDAVGERWQFTKPPPGTPHR
jgi:ribosomal protein S18 acetylase RimI-like enzyme